MDRTVFFKPLTQEQQERFTSMWADVQAATP
jgi:hypothetical protein